MVRVILPYHLRTLSGTHAEIVLDIEPPVTVRSILNALESKHPALRGTIRDHDTLQRRPFIRFFACNKDLSNDPPDTALPPEIASGAQPFLIIGAIAGG